ncbi:FecR domain-containing protein [Blastopirellula sp. JC732]|uniref:FecR domain-containing protein n=1 Tax=Blastopirellula sediminis TaxID=2894196 RepID=A0A9X1SGH7_9BACT|nr:LamG-like jellyroll fold domain-containing protein [Blastopirellula sediminis]MCC9607324.1 FecR domain-containing protein [Blastopirellula sediminis]MCC9629383.1 FecR domain-containing protein [Blastopirellula sediminis]
MTLDPQKAAELDRLISELVDSESVDSAKLDALVKILEESPEARDEYLDRIGLHASLRECKDQFELTGTTLTSPGLSQPTSAPPVWWKRSGVAWALALSLLIAIGLFRILFTTNKAHDETPVVQNDPEQPLQVERSATGAEKLFLARITQAKQANWRDDEPLAIGRVLEPRRLELESGEVEITFDSGAAVTLVGPAALTLDSTFAATLHYGKAWADVPTPAIGFTIDTPTAEVEDLGTRFAVDVSKTGDSDIVVLEGEVRVGSRQGLDPKEQIVAVNEAVRVRIDQPEILPIEVPAGLSQQSPIRSFQSEDSVPYYLWRFDANDAMGTWKEEGWNPDQKTFPAFSEQEENATGVVIRSVEGVFGRAVWMNGRGGYLETQLPGIAQDHPRTICFWVRIPKDAQPEHAYSMISWGDWSKAGGKFQVGWNSRKLIKAGVQGAIRTEISGGYVIGQNDLRDGRWHHIGIVYLGGTEEETRGDIRNRIRMYVDGQLEPLSGYRDGKVNTQISEKSEQVSFGRFLAEPAAQKAFSTFYGTLDEMYLFDGALTPSQINQLRQNNAPPAPTEIVPVRH